MAQHHKRYSSFLSAVIPVVACPSQLYPSIASKLQSVEPHSPNCLSSDPLVAGFSLRKYTGWMLCLLFAFFLTIFPNTVAIGAQTVPFPLMGEGKGGGGGPEPAKVQMQETYGKLPLYFIQNDGQVDEKVMFYEKGSGHATYFTKEGVYISLINHKEGAGSSKQAAGDKDVVAQLIGHPDSEQPDIPSTLVGVEPQRQGGGNSWELVKLTFLNANPNPEIIAVDQQDGKVNYFIGNDHKKWRTSIPTYGSVLYKEIYPGIDIKFYGNKRQLEYDIVVKPGADPSRVRFAYEGIEGLKVAENGDLEIVLMEGSIIQKKPVIYQEIEGKRVAVDGRFVIARGEVTSVIASEAKQSPSSSTSMVEGRAGVTSAFTYTFQVASYDTNHSLVIDPTLVYSTYLGGSGWDRASYISVDSTGNAYIAGFSQSSDFPTGSAVQAIYGGGSDDAFVTKLNAFGSLIYSTYIGGGDTDVTSDLAVDNVGNSYIAGLTYSGDFPTANAVQATLGGGLDAFVTKLDASGSFVFSTYLGGEANEGLSTSHTIAVDSLGNAYVVGETLSSSFPTTANAVKPTSSGYDAFVTKLDASGSFVFSTYLGGNMADVATDVAAGSANNAYITGYTYSGDFPTLNAVQTTHGGGSSDAFVTQLDALGAFVYSTYLGGGGGDAANTIAVDGTGNAYVVGRTHSSDFPTANAVQVTLGGGQDAFVTKLDAMGSFVYSTYLGGSGTELVRAIAVDSSGNTHATGYTGSNDFPTTGSAVQVSFGGVYDAFVTKLDTSGLVVYSTYLGGGGPDDAFAIALDGTSNAYITGNGYSFDFPVTANAVQTLTDGFDAFVTKLDTLGTLVYSTYLGGANVDSAYTITVDNTGNAYVAGETASNDFPTSNAVQASHGGGIHDAFVVKISAPPAELPRTGQTTCYDSAGAVIPCAGTGQDGEIQAGVPWPGPRFTDNSDYTVTDNLTGLMWTKDGNAPGPAACSPATTKTWQEALDYVACLNTNSYLGYTDWRLPNVLELESLFNAGQTTYTWLNTQGFSNVQTADYWSSTTSISDPNFAWSVQSTTSGAAQAGSKSNSFIAWPVRSGQSGAVQLWETGQTTCYDSVGNVIACTGTGQDGDIQSGIVWPSPRFTVNEDCVTDNLTGLMWTKDANLPGTYKTWQQALDYANSLSLCGYTDWHLPNRQEFLSLIDFSRFNPALPSGQPFLNVQSGGYWSSTTYSYIYNPNNYAAFVSIFSGGIVVFNKSYGLYVWPVRSGQVGPIGSTEICDGIDNDLDGLIDEGFTDTDNDGQADCVDPDDDGDGYTDTAEISVGSDPLNAASTPEACDGIDNDLDGLTDEGLTITYYQDTDNDTYGNPSISIEACSLPAGYVLDNTDCNDNDALVNPGETEVCNGVDDNCSGLIDEGVQNTYYADADNDTFGNDSVTTQACTQPSGYVSDSTDCNDSSASINPGAIEVCNVVDDNCNGQTDEGVQNTYYEDADGDTYGNASVTTQACTAPSVYVSDNTDCDDSDANIFPGATEIPNDGIDQDCDGGDSGGTGEMTNISTRAFVGTGNDRAIGGFIINGSTSKTVMIRGRGPSMSGPPFNISGTLTDPYLRLYSSSAGAYIAQNNNWGDQSDPLCANSGYACGTSTDITATGLDPCIPNPGQTSAPPGCNQESDLIITLPPGSYTVVLSDFTGGTGIGLVEIFDIDGSTTAKLVNISTRAQVLTVDKRVIGGFIVDAGTGSKQVLLRARGSSMSGAPFNIPGTLSDPYLRLYSSTAGAYIAQNDNWGDQSDALCGTSGFVCGTQADITATGLDPCIPNPGQTTAPPGCSNESAMLITLPSGSYTAVVSGVNSGTGVGLVEVFEVAP